MSAPKLPQRVRRTPMKHEATSDGGGGTADSHDASEVEKVGYRHPPKRHQWQPGKSGNPRGRPRGSKNLRTIIEEELNAPIYGSMNGKRARLTKLQYIVKRTVEAAVEGDARAVRDLITLNITMFGIGDTDRAEEAPLSDGEKAFLDAVARKFPSGDAAAGLTGDLGAFDEDSEKDGDSGDRHGTTDVEEGDDVA